MLKGNINYTQIAVDITYDPTLLQCDGYDNLNGFISACAPTAANTIGIRNVPTTNMVSGSPSSPDVTVVTLRFTVKGASSEQSAASALHIATAIVNPPAGYLGTITVLGSALPLSLKLHTQTYVNLYASVQGETNASAAYRAFAAQALTEGYPVIAQLFTATADAEAKHADDEWAILVSMGATDRPTAAVPVVGTTLENLQTAFNGETYEYTVMYPDFLAKAQAEGIAAAATIFNRAGRAEQVHAGNYADVLALLTANDYAAVAAKYATVYRCVVCGEVVEVLPANCPICYAAGGSFVKYE
jgi:rubrerythrin